MSRVSSYATNRIEAMGSGSLTLVADQKISLVSTNNVVTISGNTIVTLGPLTANRSMKVLGTLSAGTFAAFSPVYVSSASTINLIAPNLNIQGSTIVTAGYFISTGSLSSSHVISANTLYVNTNITATHVISAATLTASKSVTAATLTASKGITAHTLTTTKGIVGASLEITGSILVGGTLDVRNIVASGTHDLRLNAIADEIILTANTISMIGAVSINRTLVVSSTITAHTFVASSAMRMQTSATLTLSGSKQISLTSNSLVVVSGNIGLQNSHGLFTTGVTVLNYTTGNTTKTITSANYLVIVQVQDPLTAVTLNLPSSPLNGETHIVKGFHYGAGNATIDLVTTAANGFENGKDVSPYVLTITASATSLKSVVVTYVTSLQSWIAVFGYKN